MHSWKKTIIWQRIENYNSNAADQVRSFLLSDHCMNKIETILNKGATSKKDFTLHDADHSYRVAERMWTLIPEETKNILSVYELSFLLLSAYLHDIGMTPEYNKVQSHFQYLISKKNSLTQPEIIALQRWLDEEGEQIDIESEKYNDIEKVEELVTYYCRHKHNDWSEEWIRLNFKNDPEVLYGNWINDLVNICRSHHYGLTELKKDHFDPKKVGGVTIHLRYVAMCLRLADVIEVDPERAPEVLIKHRNIIHDSISHWLKEKYMSIEIVENTISILGTPDKAFIHKAIEDLATQVENEAILCSILAREKPLNNLYPFNDLKHDWSIKSSVFKQIKESGDYEYIDGTFRPNSKKLLQLLAGTELYGKPILAIREMIQNSLDAVKVQIGYQVAEKGNYDRNYVEELKSRFSIELSVIEEKEDYWLVCKDNGVGMDREIIKKCFLVGGAFKRRELLELERKCNKLGYDLELTSQFGIGVLSYFMIADRVIISTKKSSISGNHDDYGLRFEINGLSDFGELRSVQNIGYGTEVALRIKKELVSDIVDTSELIYFLESSLIRIPCRFKFNPLTGKGFTYNPGWCRGKAYFSEKLIQEFSFECSPSINVAKDLISEKGKKAISIAQNRRSIALQRFKKSLTFLSTTGKLSGSAGYYRIHIPVFKNGGGDSFAFFFEKPTNSKLYLEKINDGFLFFPSNIPLNIAWKGIGINSPYSARDFSFGNCFIEIDLINDEAFQLSVSRRDLIRKHSESRVIQEITDSIVSLISEHQNRFNSNKYALFNYLKASFIRLKKVDLYWTYSTVNMGDKILLEKVKLPIFFDVTTDVREIEDLKYNNNKTQRLGALKSNSGTHGFKKHSLKLDLAVYFKSYRYGILFLKTSPINAPNNYRFLGNSAAFAPSWNKFICFRGYYKEDIVLNTKSEHFKFINEADYYVVKQFIDNKTTLNSKEGREILASKSKCICFILNLIRLNEKEYWIGLTTNNPGFTQRLWKKVFKAEKKSFHFLFDSITSSGLVRISKTDWTVIKDKERLLEEVPIPSKKFVIESALKELNYML